MKFLCKKIISSALVFTVFYQTTVLALGSPLIIPSNIQQQNKGFIEGVKSGLAVYLKDFAGLSAGEKSPALEAETYLKNFADALGNGPSNIFQGNMLNMINWHVESDDVSLGAVRAVYRDPPRAKWPSIWIFHLQKKAVKKARSISI